MFDNPANTLIKIVLSVFMFFSGVTVTAGFCIWDVKSDGKIKMGETYHCTPEATHVENL